MLEGAGGKRKRAPGFSSFELPRRGGGRAGVHQAMLNGSTSPHNRSWRPKRSAGPLSVLGRYGSSAGRLLPRMKYRKSR